MTYLAWLISRGLFLAFYWPAVALGETQAWLAARLNRR